MLSTLQASMELIAAVFADNAQLSCLKDKKWHKHTYYMF